MKRVIYVLTCVVLLTSCATKKLEESSGGESAKEKKLVQQADIKQAVEMRRFLIKFDRLYTNRGGRMDLRPASNYILIDGDRVVISAGYIGRQYDLRPIRGIDMVGRLVSFQLKNNTSKGTYEIKMKASNDQNTFDVSVSVTNTGYCNASISSARIDFIRYTGNFIPLKPKVEKEEKVEPDNLEI